MVLTTILSIALLTSSHELAITKAHNTPNTIAAFNGVVVSIEDSSLQAVSENATVVVPNFPLGADSEVQLRLERFDVFTPNAEVVVGSINKAGDYIDTHIARPNLVLLRGTIVGDPSSRVFLALGEHTSNGLIETEGKTYVLAKDKSLNLTVVYNLSDVDSEKMNWVDFQCDVEDSTKKIIEQQDNQSQRVSGGGCQALQMAIETDWEFTNDLFRGDVAESSEYATTLIAAVSSITNSEVGYAVQIPFLRLWNNSSDPWTGSTTGAQLGEFRTYWVQNMDHVSRHLAHFLSGRTLGGGKAYVGAVCTNYGFAVSGNLRGSFPIPVEDHNYNNWDLFVVAHETGHNIGTRHTHDYTPPIDGCGNGDCSAAWGGTIMSYCHQCSGGLSNIVLSYATRVRATIQTYLDLTNSADCVFDCNSNIPGICCVGEMCSELTGDACTAIGGVFLGTATTCVSNSCVVQSGACCLGGAQCSELDNLVCASSGGVFLGNGSTCAVGGCGPNAEYACCLGTNCAELTQSSCTAIGGTWAGIGETCNGGGCDPLSNDFCDTARELNIGSWGFTTEGAISGTEPFDNVLCNSEYLGGVYSDVWFTYTACETGNLLVSTCGSIDFDSDIIVYEGTCNSLVQIECNGDGAGCGGFTSELNVGVFAGETYLIRVGGFSEASQGSGQLVLGGQNCYPSDSPCVGDINVDGFVTVEDLLEVMGHWAENSPLHDLDENGIVGISDILLLVSSWGVCE
ncbi:MAG TPA: hypothetical protein EYO01_04610 [Phycisphaerales bacterium]|nr:hypothetical protein [Phycisphaerales bacterium]HIN84518.1 hypothetical protein [Phycisphaerales bacterium]HIO52460.1 hypothetical protein [Phycisphaerales bacterium]